MSIFSRPKKDVLIAAFDVASSSIGGVLFFYHPDKLPEVLITARFPTDFLPDLNFAKIQRSLHKTFERTIAALKNKMPGGRKKPDLTIIMFSSPYYVSQSKIIRLPKLKPFKISEKFLRNLVGDETASFKKKWPETETVEIEEMGISPERSEFSLYFSLGIKAMQDKLKECVSHSFGEIPVRFQSFPFVAFTALKTVMGASGDLLLIDIGGEITDLILIKEGILEETISFPIGENFLVRKIANAFHFPLEESFSLLRQYARGDLHADSHKKIREIAEDAGGRWCQFFERCAKESPDFASLPKNLLFIGGAAALTFKDAAVCVKEKSFRSQFLLPEALKNHFNFRHGFNEDKDISLMFLILFADKLFLNRY
jgi:hypothetical protein